VKVVVLPYINADPMKLNGWKMLCYSDVLAPIGLMKNAANIQIILENVVGGGGCGIGTPSEAAQAMERADAC